MRRKRQRLQVTTFPFMAVLLCVLGSLILLLLVIDRRAKIVAQATAQKDAHSAAARDQAELDRLRVQREAEWKRRRQELHNLLLSQQQQVLSQLQQVRQQEGEAQSRLVSFQTDEAALLQTLSREKAALLKLQGEVHSKQDLLTRSGKESELSQKGLAQLANELAQMESVLQGLKALRRQNQRTYSVVPYSGKFGENRQPVYAECTHRGVVFHPDGLRLEFGAFSPLAVRRELDRRIQDHLTGTNKADKTRKPYLFVLVRPDGLDSYYAVQAALAGLYIDFGYELIDQDWALDFSGGAMSLPKSPTILAAAPQKAPGNKTIQGYKAGKTSAGQQTGWNGPAGPGQPGGTGSATPGVPAYPGQPTSAAWKAAGNKGVSSDASGAGNPPGSVSGPFPGVGGTTVAFGEGAKAGGGFGPGAAAGGFPGSATTPPVPGSGIGPGGLAPSQSGSSGLVPGNGAATPSSGSPFPGNATAGPPGSPSDPAGATIPPFPGLEPGTAPGWPGTFGPANGNTTGGTPGQPVGWRNPLASALPGTGQEPGSPGTGGQSPQLPDGQRGSGEPGTGGGQSGPGLPRPPGSAGSAAGSQPSAVGQTSPGASGPHSPNPGGGQGNAPTPGLGFDPGGMPSAGPAGEATGATSAQMAHGTGTPGAGGSVSSGMAGGQGATGQPAGGSSGGGSGGGATQFGGSGSGQGGDAPEDGGEPGPQLKGFNFANPDASTKVKMPRPPALPLSRLMGNRDWYVPIEFRADGVVLPLTQEQFSLADLQRQQPGNSPLAKSLQATVARRQAAVRPGEPPYRAILRFEVYPNGLRVFHLAYPLLEDLRLPMVRRNVEPEEPDLSNYYRK